MPEPETIVVVTGASGFIASHIVRELLARGYRVHGTVRDPGKAQALRALPGAAERLELVQADLLTEGAFDAPVRGATYMIHTASPYTLDVEDPQRDLVAPAVRGTTNVLDACTRVSSVKRVVLTSSMAAITDEPESDHVLTEKDWNGKSSLDRNPYYYSKTLAERAGWDFMEAKKPAFELVVMNPFLVIGPSLSPALNPSNQLFVDLLKGTYPGIMNLTWGFVDVRDVATAHVMAMQKQAAKGRYICAGTTISMRDVVALLAKSGYGGYKLPKLGMDCTIGDYAVKLSSYFQPKGVGTYLRTHVGRVPRYDNGKSRRELGIDYRSVETSILDTLEDLTTWGHVPALA